MAIMAMRTRETLIDVPCRKDNGSLKPLMPGQKRVVLFCQTCQRGKQDARCIISGKQVSEHIEHQRYGIYRDPPAPRLRGGVPTASEGERARLNRADYQKNLQATRVILLGLDGKVSVGRVTELLGLHKSKSRTVYVWLCKLQATGIAESEGEGRLRVWGPTKPGTIGGQNHDNN